MAGFFGGSRPRMAVAGMALLLALAGCSAGQGAPVPQEGDTQTSAARARAIAGGAPAAGTEGATPKARPAPETPAATSAAPAPVSPAGCLAGKWKLRNETFAEALHILMAGSVPAEHRIGFAVSGESLMHFGDDGVYGQSMDGFTLSIETGADTAVHVQSSAHQGNYSATSDTIQISNLEQLFMDATLTAAGVTATLTGDGTTGTVSIFGHSTEVAAGEAQATDGSGRYTCTQEMLTVTSVEGAAADFSRIG